MQRMCLASAPSLVRQCHPSINGLTDDLTVVLDRAILKKIVESFLMFFAKILGVVGVGAPLVRLGWRPPGLSVPLPPLSSPAP